MSWLLAIGGFAALVVLHEAGHFTAAKMVGMRVEKFFLFFPPRVASVKRGETEYGIGAIPLGGYVKITGMNPEEEIPPEVVERAYYRQPVWKRIFVIAAGPAVNIVLALVMFFFLAVGFGLDGDVTNRVGTVSSDLPAAGQLQEGDQLISVDGRDVSDLTNVQLANTVRRQVNTHSCAGEPTDGCKATTPVTLRVLRDGEPVTLKVTPVYEVPEDIPGTDADESQDARMVIGFGYEAERERTSLGEGIDFSLDRAWFITSTTADVLAHIFEKDQREQISGVVGNTEITKQSFDTDTRQAFLVLAVISLSLGVINLLPFLPLDGGHIFWAIVEKVRGRPVSLVVMERSGLIGFALVMVLFLIGLQNDIDRLGDGGFGTR
ncbi:MAG: RIP metalloprotease [Solirubrobacterales bacterium]|nr:RIP metalloprotease [Thermoleophilales bacterium]MCO5326730.1 RIP metalloprotease [Solirubrobacterales bacterium]